MSSKMVYTCDCCKKELKTNHGTDGNIGIRFSIDYDSDGNESIYNRDMHLCMDCAKKIKNFINNIQRGLA